MCCLPRLRPCSCATARCSRQGRLGRRTQLGRLGARRSAAAFVAASVAPRRRARPGAASRRVGLIRRFPRCYTMVTRSGKAWRGVCGQTPISARRVHSGPSQDALPAIYHRLFRFEAVTDPRFLVGRDGEMAAIKEARALWESERPVAIAVVGARGSGKTSLINCALAGPLDGLPVIRGQFSERLSTGAEVGHISHPLLTFRMWRRWRPCWPRNGTLWCLRRRNGRLSATSTDLAGFGSCSG